jgi:ArsR family transcriptional regulator, virulence genes transcriptional regulator
VSEVISTQIANPSMKEQAEKAACLLKLLSNECRLLILCYLLEGERTVTQLNETVLISQSALSQHLAKLRAEKLVKIRKEAQNVFYSINSPEATAVISLMSDLYCSDKSV